MNLSCFLLKTKLPSNKVKTATPPHINKLVSEGHFENKIISLDAFINIYKGFNLKIGCNEDGIIEIS